MVDLHAKQTNATEFCPQHGMAQKTDLRAVQLYEKKEPKIRKLRP